MDAAKPNPLALKQGPLAHNPETPQADLRAEALGRMIAEALGDFDPESPSERRLKVNAVRSVVTFPPAWAKKAG